ncbi:MAG TPA: dihydrolipoyl dehydrogenase [Abditibacteriaceae bacterium]|nr:dihydrolipoyl dehydrogenase [Abditibacteriaceae bacterium]
MSTPPRPQTMPGVATETVATEVVEPVESETLDVPLPPIVIEEPELPPLDPESVVEEAEQLLRESAPHDFDVLVIGAGPGGYGAAIRAAQLGARVGLVEEREIGGVCLNRGSLPTKALLESVDLLRLMRRAAEYGIRLEGSFRADFAAMQARRQAVVAQMREHVTQLLTACQIKIIQGRARFVEEHTVEITSAEGSTRRVRAVDVIIATGSTPQRLPVPGCDLPGVVTSDELLQDELLQEATIPDSFLVIGSGAVGLEFAYLYAELGARVTLIESAADILPGEDSDVSRTMARVLTERGISIVTSAQLQRIEPVGSGLNVVYERAGKSRRMAAAKVLLAGARRANTAGLGLDGIGVEHEQGRILVDEYCATNVHGVYAVGDCVRHDGWAHHANAEGRMAAEVIMKYPSTIDLRYVPSCCYTHPEIASVGSTQAAAEAAGRRTRVGVFHFRANDKAVAAGDSEGFVKVVVDDESDQLLGCQIIGPHATELINEAVLALRTGQTVEGLASAIHAHPTLSEALPQAALAARFGAPGIE